jgi:hypothetical protein
VHAAHAALHPCVTLRPQPFRPLLLGATTVATRVPFTKTGVRSSVVHSQKPHEVTRLELAHFRQGQLDVLWNVEQLTEGFDEPAIAAVLMARPTKSRALYAQARSCVCACVRARVSHGSVQARCTWLLAEAAGGACSEVLGAHCLRSCA